MGLSVLPPSTQSSPNQEATQAPIKALQQPSRKEDEGEEKAQKKEAKEYAKRQKKEQKELDRQAAREAAKSEVQAAKEAAKSRTATESHSKREKQRQDKLRELADLMEQDRVAPPTWSLQLPSLPPRQNVTGRDLPLKVPSNDVTIPSTEAARNAFVAELLDAMGDVRQAEDAVSPTVDFWYVWLKPSLEGKYSYNEHDMEWICRKLVSIAEGLHNYGLGATEIFCPRTIQKAQAAKEMTFKERIDKLASLMRKSKARCNNFMLNNSLEDTIALIDLKTSDHVSNGNNNRTRSLKLRHSNNLLGMEKGMKWPRNENGMLVVPEVTVRAPVNAPSGSNDVGILKEDNAEDALSWYNEDLQLNGQVFPSLSKLAQQDPTPHQPAPTLYLNPLAYPDPMRQDPLSYPNHGFDGFPGHASQPLTQPVNDWPPPKFDAATANRSFDAVYAAHQSIPTSAELDQDFMEQFVLFDDDQEPAQDARRKRPRHEQVDELSINSLLRGKTARPSTQETISTRR
ncbi:hypothetical protein SVAN01_08899 [Stagonosporopsis vannaccii]|nr:hypothetical protein SVAN01_08899 [Stagonosporopsis vannaccii]